MAAKEKHRHYKEMDQAHKISSSPENSQIVEENPVSASLEEHAAPK